MVQTWLNNRKFKTELLYRKSKDGSTPDDFHKKCDNKGTTITFIETNKGYKFGGYTELQWDTYSNCKKDNLTFLFSFNKRKKYPIVKNNGSIYCYPTNGPRFGHTSMPEIYTTENINKVNSYVSRSY